MSDNLGIAATEGDAAATECRTQINSLYQKAVDLLEMNKDKLDKIAEALLEKETLNEADLDALVA